MEQGTVKFQQSSLSGCMHFFFHCQRGNPMYLSIANGETLVTTALRYVLAY